MPLSRFGFQPRPASKCPPDSCVNFLRTLGVMSTLRSKQAARGGLNSDLLWGEKKDEPSRLSRGMFAKAHLFPTQGMKAVSVIKDVLSNRYIQVSSLVLIAAMLYYAFLSWLYLVDEIHDVAALRELNLTEKLTIRVIAPRKIEALHKFVSKYSICPVVEEVQITWGHTKEAPPSVDSFTYSKTHSTVVFEQVNSDSGDWPPSHYSSSLPSRTEAVMLLDADVLVDCDDIKFAQSVWRSGRETMVGFLPRIHMKWTYDDGRLPEYTYHGWSRVWWNSAYSLMLSGAAIIHRDLLEQTRSSLSLVQVLSEHPECHNVGLSMWMSSKHRRPVKESSSSVSSGDHVQESSTGNTGAVLRPPMWAQVGVRRQSAKASAMSAHVDDQEEQKWAARSGEHSKLTTCQCLTNLARALDIEDLSYVRSRAVIARKKFFW